MYIRVEETSQSLGDETRMPSAINKKAKNPKILQSYAAVTASKPIQTPERPWTKVNYGNQKSGTTKASPTKKKEQCG